MDNTNMIMGGATLGNTPSENGEVNTSQNMIGNVLSSSPSHFIAQYAKPHQQVRKYKIHRNDPCPCQSGKKYKNCCLASGEYEGYVSN